MAQGNPLQRNTLKKGIGDAGVANNSEARLWLKLSATLRSSCNAHCCLILSTQLQAGLGLERTDDTGSVLIYSLIL